jgi:hypothetical protein
MAFKKTIKNDKDLETVLNQYILSAMKSIAKDAEQTVKDYIESDVYDAGTPSTYKRTGELRKSVKSDVYQVGGFTNAEIYHDPMMMKPVAPYKGNNYMGQHHSTVKGYFPQEYSYYLPRVINDGRSGKIFGDGYWTKPRPYFTNAESFIFRTFKRDLKLKLQSRGLKVK